MTERPVKVHCAGCSLLDNLYSNVSFSSNAFDRYHSRRTSDGGLVPGQLVFAEDLANFAEKPFEHVLSELTGDKLPDSSNIGGPAIVALIHAAQLYYGRKQTFFSNNGVEVSAVGRGAHFSFFGTLGNDRNGRTILDKLQHIPVDITNYRTISGNSPTTDVLSDPHYAEGAGERTFINRLGVAEETVLDGQAESIDPISFLDADVVVFGGTGLTPELHKRLPVMLKQAKTAKAFTVVTTVYDFINEKKNPGGPWPLTDNYNYIDLLIMDREEAAKISGKKSSEEALQWFGKAGIGAVIITQGTEEVLWWNTLTGLHSLPLCKKLLSDLRQEQGPRDTTGAGDNFAGGVLVSLVWQLEQYRAETKDSTVTAPGAFLFDLKEAVRWGIVSGGYACKYLGGTFYESISGEKYGAVSEYYRWYKQEQP